MVCLFQEPWIDFDCFQLERWITGQWVWNHDCSYLSQRGGQFLNLVAVQVTEPCNILKFSFHNERSVLSQFSGNERKCCLFSQQSKRQSRNISSEANLNFLHSFQHISKLLPCNDSGANSSTHPNVVNSIGIICFVEFSWRCS